MNLLKEEKKREFIFEHGNMLYVSQMIWDPGGFLFLYWVMEYYFSLRVILVYWLLGLIGLMLYWDLYLYCNSQLC